MIYNGLFEDEISELLREQKTNDYTITHDGKTYKKVTWAFFEDGLIYSPVDLFYYHDSGNNRYFIGHNALIRTLSHAQFRIN